MAQGCIVAESGACSRVLCPVHTHHPRVDSPSSAGLIQAPNLDSCACAVSYTVCSLWPSLHLEVSWKQTFTTVL